MQRGFSVIWIALVLVAIISFGAGAYYLGKHSSPQPTPAPYIPPSSTPSPVSDKNAPLNPETANWKTYTNSFLHFTIRYPSDWKQVSLPNNIWIMLQSSDYTLDSTPRVSNQPVIKGMSVSIPVAKDAGKISFTDVQEGGVIVSSTEKVAHVKNFTLDGQSALEYDFQTMDTSPAQGTIVEVKMKDNKVYILEADYASVTSRELFNQILSTFKFTSPDQTTNWQTYSSAKSGYSIKYPKTWHISQENPGTSYERTDIDAPEQQSNGFTKARINIEVDKGNYSITPPNYTENYTIDGIKGYKNSLPAAQNPAQELLYFHNGNNYYTISMFYDGSTQYKDTYNQILSTFKFT